MDKCRNGLLEVQQHQRRQEPRTRQPEVVVAPRKASLAAESGFGSRRQSLADGLAAVSRGPLAGGMPFRVRVINRGILVAIGAGLLLSLPLAFQNCSPFKVNKGGRLVSPSVSDTSGIVPALVTVAEPNVAPAIFFVPHQDDDAIGFAGAIGEFKAAGRPVFVVLISRGNDEFLLGAMNGTKDCFINQDWLKAIWDLFPEMNFAAEWNGHPVSHSFGLTMDDIVLARNKEFLASTLKMGVDQVFFVNGGQGIDDTEFYSDYEGATKKVANIIREFQLKFPQASFKFPSGLKDYCCGTDTVPWTRNNTHMAINQAALDARASYNLADVKFYRIYAYWNPEKNYQQAPWTSTQSIEPSGMQVKRLALHEYKVFDPSKGRYALGYHSVPDLIDRAMVNSLHYFDEQ